MIWIKSFFKVVEETKLIYVLEINPAFINQNLSSFLKLSNFDSILREDIEEYLRNNFSYDNKLRKLDNIIKKIEKETIEQINNKNFVLIKYDEFYSYFYIDKSNFNENFCLERETGSIIIKPNSTYLSGRNLANLEIPNEYNIMSKKSRELPKLANIRNPIILDIENGLSILAETSCKKTEDVIGIIFDAGNAFSSRVSIAEKIINHFKTKNIDEIICILSHEHMDHYNVFNLEEVKNWLSSIKSTAVYYEDIDIASKLSFVSSCQKKIPVKREDKILKFGDISLKTFKAIAPVPTHKQNAASMVMHSDGVTFSGDQSYENIEKNWMIDQNFFQVPHHGSEYSGNFKLAKNNKNAVPSYKIKNLPTKKVRTYFENNKDIIEKIMIDCIK